jgi:hypothetical protein
LIVLECLGRKRYIRARFIKIETKCGEGTSSEIKKALELSAMRKRMAADCDARVILGGKTRPKASAGDQSRYSGRLPVQRHLDQRKGEAIVAVKGGRLSGDYVILETVGDIGELDRVSTKQPP